MLSFVNKTQLKTTAVQADVGNKSRNASLNRLQAKHCHWQRGAGEQLQDSKGPLGWLGAARPCNATTFMWNPRTAAREFAWKSAHPSS
jgi:hypothetical protein